MKQNKHNIANPCSPVLLEQLSKGKHPRGLFKCSCNNIFEADIGNIKSRHTKSCGCFRKKTSSAKAYKHGHSIPNNIANNRTYKTWKAMRERCNNKKCKYYKIYGGRGIKVCERWNIYENFVEDMGKRPKGLTIDRIDNDKGYYKENCRWATKSQQMRNQTKTIRIMFKSKEYSLKDLYEKYESCISFEGVWWRLKHGWHFLDAISKPKRSKRPFRLKLGGLL